MSSTLVPRWEFEVVNDSCIPTSVITTGSTEHEARANATGNLMPGESLGAVIRKGEPRVILPEQSV
jgi:hypothetical protein